MNKAIKYRIYPTEEQKVLFAKTFGCCRKIWNLMLADRENAYRKEKRTINPTPAMYKRLYPYLREVDSLALANVQLDLQDAFRRFFTVKGTGHPVFKSKKHAGCSYTTNNQKGSVRIEGGRLRLPKAGFVRMKQHREIPDGHTIKSVTISREPSGKYYASILTEYEADIPDIILDPENSMGLDYSSPHFYKDSKNNSADMPHFYREAEDHLAREQRKLKHKTIGSTVAVGCKLVYSRQYAWLQGDGKTLHHAVQFCNLTGKSK